MKNKFWYLLGFLLFVSGVIFMPKMGKEDIKSACIVEKEKKYLVNYYRYFIHTDKGVFILKNSSQYYYLKEGECYDLTVSGLTLGIDYKKVVFFDKEK